MLVRHLDGDRFSISVRGHELTVDQPVEDGGEDTAPTPTELFVAGLASCVGFYVRRYLARHQLSQAGLTVSCDYVLGSRPARVSEVRIQVGLPDGVPAEQQAALLAVASHCTVHNSLRVAPEVTVELAGAPAQLSGTASGPPSR